MRCRRDNDDRLIAWAPALVLAVATSVGSVLGVKYAVKADPKKLKRLVAVLVVLACLGVAAPPTTKFWRCRRPPD